MDLCLRLKNSVEVSGINVGTTNDETQLVAEREEEPNGCCSGDRLVRILDKGLTVPTSNKTSFETGEVAGGVLLTAENPF